MIGRLEDLSDVFIDNHTVSRKHAILQARSDDHALYLFDLGSAHGTFVNKERLPSRTFKKLSPFDSLKFGISSRSYVLRCPAYEELLDNEQTEKENRFAELVQNQHRQLSKEELKEKYLDMLENDPNFAANQQPRTLQGREREAVEEEYEGIDWGITDEQEVYKYKNDNEFPIEPDILRRLNLDSAQLNKLSDYEEHLRKYQEVEAELNELTARQKREYGLEEKLQAKKDKLERRFVEAVEALEKSEDWLRTNIFGASVDRDKKNIVKIREKENDTFGDDEYLDRTLENREAAARPESLAGSISSEDYWKLEKELNESLKNLDEVRGKIAAIEKGSGLAESKEEEDEFDAFMKDNNTNLDSDNLLVFRREEQLLLDRVELIKAKFKTILGEEELKKMTARPARPESRSIKEEFKEKSLEESLMETKKRMEVNQNIENILSRLEAINEEEEELNELDPSIFNYYKGRDKEEPEAEEDIA